MKKAKIITGCLLVSIFLSLTVFQTNYFEKQQQTTTNKQHPEEIKSASESGGGYIMNTYATYSWIEIKSTGTLMASISNHDYASQLITLLWNVTFYETNYTTLRVNVDGWMSFTYSGSSSSGDIPDYEAKNKDCVALFWDDLITRELDGGSGEIYYQFLSSPDRLVVEYYNVSYYGDDIEHLGTFEVIFYRTGKILFQYQSLAAVDVNDITVGLDHGDLINYNSYTGINGDNLPISSKAIEFIFNQMSEDYFSFDFEEEDELAWQVDDLDDDAMEIAFGTNWEYKFGLFSDVKKDKKTKIILTSIEESSTYWNIEYDMWDWISKDKDFDDESDTDLILSYLKDPSQYSEHNLTNLFPFLLPDPPYLYVITANLADFYDDFDVDEDSGSLEIYVRISISSDIIRCYAYYTEAGLLESLRITWNYDTTIFSMSRCYPSTGDYSGEINIFEFFTTPIGWLTLGGIIAAVVVIGILVVKRRKRNSIPKSSIKTPVSEKRPSGSQQQIQFATPPTLDKNIEIQKINREIDKVNQYLDELLKKFVDSHISQENYLEMKNKLYEKLGDLQGKLSILQDKS